MKSLVLLVFGIIAISLADAGCAKRPLTCDNSNYNVLLMPSDGNQKPIKAVAGCGTELRLMHGSSNKFALESKFGGFEVKKFCCQAKAITKFQVQYQYAEETQFGPAIGEKWVHVEGNKEWNKFCFDVISPIVYLQLNAFPAQDQEENMYIRKCKLKACEEA